MEFNNFALLLHVLFALQVTLPINGRCLTTRVVLRIRITTDYSNFIGFIKNLNVHK